MNAFHPLLCDGCKPHYHDPSEPSEEGCNPREAKFWMCDECHNEFDYEDDANDCCAPKKERER